MRALVAFAEFETAIEERLSAIDESAYRASVKKLLREYKIEAWGKLVEGGVDTKWPPWLERAQEGFGSRWKDVRRSTQDNINKLSDGGSSLHIAAAFHYCMHASSNPLDIRIATALDEAAFDEATKKALGPIFDVTSPSPEVSDNETVPALLGGRKSNEEGPRIGSGDQVQPISAQQSQSGLTKALSALAAASILAIAISGWNLSQTSREKQPGEPGIATYLSAMKHLKAGDEQKYVDDLVVANRRGSANAAAALGRAYKNGGFVPSDPASGAKLAKIALDRGLAVMAARGDAEAQMNYGLLNLEGLGVPKKEERGLELLNDAHVNGHSRATLHLARIYLRNSNQTDDCRGFDLAENARKAGQLDAYDIEAGYYIADLCPTKVSKVPDSQKKAVSLLSYAAERGDRNAQLSLGRMYYFNKGIPTVNDRFAIALDLFRKAASSGNKIAQFNLGTMYRDNIGIPKNPKNDLIAVRWLKKSADQNFTKAQTALGHMYEMNRGVPSSATNLKTAFELYMQAARSGESIAQYNVANMYDNERGVTKNPENAEQAIKWYKKSAAQQDADAKNNLGVMYRDGDGVAINKQVARDWFQQAALQNHQEAQINLGLMYEKFQITAKKGTNVEAAEGLFRKAADAGNLRAKFLVAQNLLGRFKKDSDQGKEAYRLLEEASDGGHSPSSSEYGRLLYRDAKNGTVGQALAIKRFKLARKQKSSYGAYLLGEAFFELGEYECTAENFEVELTKEEAREALEFSANEGNSCAQNLIGASYEAGIFHPIDKMKALNFYSQSAQLENQNGLANYNRLSESLGTTRNQTVFRTQEELAEAGYVPALCSAFYDAMFTDEKKNPIDASYFLRQLRERGAYSDEEANQLFSDIANNDESSKDKTVCSPARDGVIMRDRVLGR